MRVVVKGQRNRKGGPLSTDFGLGGTDTGTIIQARERVQDYRILAKSGLHPQFHGQRENPTVEDIGRQAKTKRLPR